MLSQLLKMFLKKGTYLGVLKDLDGKKQNNYYFAAPINIDGNKQILFIRVKHVAGRNKLFYIHDVFTDEEIKEAAPYSGEQNANLRSLRVAALAKSIIQDYEKYKYNAPPFLEGRYPLIFLTDKHMLIEIEVTPIFKYETLTFQKAHSL